MPQLFISCLLLLPWSLWCQNELPRRPLLGIQLQNLTIAQSIEAGTNGSYRVGIGQVFSETTAAQLGLATGDILMEINEHAIYSNQDLFEVLGQARAGDPVTVKVWRAHESQHFSGVFLSYPLPAHSGGTLTLGAVPFQNGFLRSFLHIPEGEGPFPTIYFLQGYTCGSVEYSQATHPFNRLIQQYVDAGYAVFRVEKPGVGDCQGTPDCMEIDFPTEMAAFSAAYEYMQNLSEVDTQAITLYGHSLGGLVAPLLAQKFQPQAVVVFGTLLHSWDDYLIELYRFQWPLEGRDYAEVERQVQLVKDLYHQYFHEKKAPKELEASPEEMAVFNDMMNIQGETMIQRHYTFWQTLNEQNFVEAWKNYRGRVLALYGEYDVAALDEDAALEIAEVVNHYHPGHGTFQLVPGTNHSLLLVDSKKHSYDLHLQGQMGQHGVDHYNQKYALQIMEWLQSVQQSQP